MTDRLSSRPQALSYEASYVEPMPVMSDPMSPVMELERSSNQRRETVRVGIASMPGREKTLSQVLYRIAPQADEVFVYLNNMSHVPEECVAAPDNVRFFTGPDLGDRGKFIFLEDFTGYYVTVDDDIDYARYHVASLIAGIERYARRAIVGWHGSILSEPIDRYYRSRSRKILSYMHEYKEDTEVHVLGTGTIGFHTDTIRLVGEDFCLPNMADIFLAIQAKRQGIKMIVLAHAAKEALPLETTESISETSLGQTAKRSAHLDVAAMATRLVRENGPWPPLEGASERKLRRLDVKIVYASRHGYGGTAQAAAQMHELLVPHGSDVEVVDVTEVRLPETQMPDVVLVYIGDTTEGRFRQIHDIIEYFAGNNVPVLVSYSHVNRKQHSGKVNSARKKWRGRFGDFVHFMSTERFIPTESDRGLFDESVIRFPHALALSVGTEPVVEHGTSTGIFVGDISGYYNSSADMSAWIGLLRVLRSAVPEARISAVISTQGHHELPPGIDLALRDPSNTRLDQMLRSTRLAVLLNEGDNYVDSSFEAAVRGVPVLSYDTGRGLLTETEKLPGITFRDENDLARSAQVVYRDALIWRGISRLCFQKASEQNFELVSAETYLTVLNVVKRLSKRKRYV